MGGGVVSTPPCPSAGINLLARIGLIKKFRVKDTLKIMYLGDMPKNVKLEKDVMKNG